MVFTGAFRWCMLLALLVVISAEKPWFCHELVGWVPAAAVGDIPSCMHPWLLKGGVADLAGLPRVQFGEEPYRYWRRAASV